MDRTDGELAGRAIVADVRHMDGVLGRGDDGLLAGADQAIDEAGEARLLARRGGLGLLGLVGEALGAHEAVGDAPSLGLFQRLVHGGVAGRRGGRGPGEAGVGRGLDERRRLLGMRLRRGRRRGELGGLDVVEDGGAVKGRPDQVLVAAALVGVAEAEAGAQVWRCIRSLLEARGVWPRGAAGLGRGRVGGRGPHRRSAGGSSKVARAGAFAVERLRVVAGRGAAVGLVRGGPLDEFATLGIAVQRRALAVHDGFVQHAPLPKTVSQPTHKRVPVTGLWPVRPLDALFFWGACAVCCVLCCACVSATKEKKGTFGCNEAARLAVADNPTARRARIGLDNRTSRGSDAVWTWRQADGGIGRSGRQSWARPKGKGEAVDGVAAAAAAGRAVVGGANGALRYQPGAFPSAWYLWARPLLL